MGIFCQLCDYRCGLFGRLSYYDSVEFMFVRASVYRSFCANKGEKVILRSLFFRLFLFVLIKNLYRNYPCW